ncbi:MAG: sulfite exporter TauE/SafE family protein [Acidobacteria bacterium]|nr:sulfite exporter TauE/SafE family protein [Acidobacteriota bacterium]
MYVLGLILSVAIGVSLGLLGGGGSILTVPILLYVFGASEHQAIATSLFVVGTTSGIGALQHARRGNVNFRVGMLFGIASMIGAFAGARVGSHLPGQLLLGLFAAMMLLTAGAMLRKRREPAQVSQSQRGVAWIIVDGLLVGAFTGMVGAGGGFLVVPALAVLGKLPIRQAMGTSLMVICFKSFAGFAGYVTSVELSWTLSLSVTVAAVAGTFIGTRMAHVWSPESLRRSFGYFVLAMAIYILLRELVF